MLLLLCSIRRGSGRNELGYVQYMMFATSLDEVSETLKCMYLQWVKSRSKQNGHDLEKSRRAGSWWRQVDSLNSFRFRVL